MSDSLPPLSDVVERHGLAAKKSLGQNFILDLNLMRRIARLAGAQEGACYEVGPGPGGLTRALFLEGAACIVAVERDRRCLEALEDIAAFYPGRLKILHEDAVKIDEAALLGAEGITPPVPVAANLPFNVGSLLLVKWLTAPFPFWWSRLTLMFQHEVALRLVAKPGDEAYGRLSVLAQWRSEPHVAFTVSRAAFVPRPNVDAAVVVIEPLAAPRFPAALNDLERVTAAAFGQRRKMLRGSLKSLGVDAAALLDAAAIDGERRAETLSLEEFCALARAYAARIG